MKQLQIAGIVLLVIAAICLFIAYERYQANADAVQAMNQMGGGLLRDLAGGGELTPGTPAATKYALLFAVVFGAGGGYCLWKSTRPPST